MVYLYNDWHAESTQQVLAICGGMFLLYLLNIGQSARSFTIKQKKLETIWINEKKEEIKQYKDFCGERNILYYFGISMLDISFCSSIK